MPIFEKIQQEIRDAMVLKDTVRRDCLRSVVSEVKNLTVNANPPCEIDDTVCLKVVSKAVKSHKDSISQFEKAGRDDLVEKERVELDVLEDFLPKTLDEAETFAEIEGFLSESGLERTKRNMGSIIKGISGVPGLDRSVAAKILQRILA